MVWQMKHRALNFNSRLALFSTATGLTIILSGQAVWAIPSQRSVAFSKTNFSKTNFSKTNRKINAPYASAQDIDRLFGEEILLAANRLKWHGERLTDDTTYAIALTGTSWELAWGKEHLFSLASDNCGKNGARGRKDPTAAADVRASFERHDYQNVVRIASTRLALDDVSCDPDQKEEVGTAFLELGQPERAFAIFATPFDAHRAPPDPVTINRKFREGAFTAAVRAGLHKEAVVFALSLLLESGDLLPLLDSEPVRYLEREGVDIDRVLLGILEAPERLRGLPGYYYAAADLLTLRANPRLLPVLVHLADSNDPYLRARALLALGVIAYRPHAGEPGDWAPRVINTPLREYGISAGQRQIIGKLIQAGVNSDHYRVRQAAALALGLMGDNDNVNILQKLAKDRVYVLSSAPSRHNAERTLIFPVRAAASIALARYGININNTNNINPGGGTLSGRALDAARHGGQDVTNDRRGLRHEIWSAFVISPVDVPLDIAPFPARH